MVSTAVGDETTQDMADDTIAGSDADAARSSAATDDLPPDEAGTVDADSSGRGQRWVRAIAYGLLPAVAFALACGAGYLKWQYDSARGAAAAQSQSVAAATESTIALLSYQPDTVDKQLTAAAAAFAERADHCEIVVPENPDFMVDAIGHIQEPLL